MAYGIDNARLTVWFEVAHEQDPTQAGALCRRHADALVVPKGWTIDDRREPVPKLFRTQDTTVVDKAKSRTKDKRKTAPSTKVKQSLVAVPSLLDKLSPEEYTTAIKIVPSVPVVAAVVEDAHLDETQAIPWMPKLVRRGDYDIDQSTGQPHGDDTASHGRLMRRAFGDRPQG